MAQHGRSEICGVSLGWIEREKERWVCCKELKDRRLHKSNVQKRAEFLNLRLRAASEEEVAVFKKIGSIASHRCGPLLHEDDIMFLIESCESFPVFLDSSLESQNSPEKRDLPLPKEGKIAKAEIEPEKVVKSEEKMAAKKRGRTPKKKPNSEEIKKAEEIEKLSEKCPISEENPAPRKRPNRASKKSYHESLSDESLIEEMSRSSSPEKEPSSAQENQSKTAKNRKKVGRPPKKSKDPPVKESSAGRPSRTPKKNYQESDESLVDEDLLPGLSPEKEKTSKEPAKKRNSKKTKVESTCFPLALSLEKPSSESELSASSQDSAKPPQHQDLDLSKPPSSSSDQLPTSEATTAKPTTSPPKSALSKSEITSNQNGTTSPSSNSRKPRIKSIRSSILRPPNLTITDLGRIEFSEEMLKAAKLWKSPKKLLREQLEVERLARQAKRILEREKKQAEKEAKRIKKEEKINKDLSLKKSPARPDRLRQSIKAPDKSLPYEKKGEVAKTRIKKSANGKITKDRSLTKKRKSFPEAPKSMPPPPEPEQPQVLGCVTFKSGDNIIRRSPRKLPEAAKTAVNQQTGVIPYAFAALLGNTHGVIPAGLTEKHFLSYRPAMKRASNHWLEEIDSGLDSTDELAALQVLLNQSQKDAKRVRKQHKPERKNAKLESNELSDNKNGSEGGSTSGDSGRETPTTAGDVFKPFSLQKLKLESTSTAEIFNELDARSYSLSSFCLGRNYRPEHS